VRGDFGNSIRQDEPALSLVLERLPATLELTLAAMVISVLVAFRRGSSPLPGGGGRSIREPCCLPVRPERSQLLAGHHADPSFFGVLGVVPAFGRGGLENLVLPALTLSMYSMARTARLIRSG